MLTKRACIVLGVPLMGFFVAAPASADDGWGNADCSQIPVPGCELSAGTGANGGPPPTGPPAASPQDPVDQNSGAMPASGENLAQCGYRPSEYESPGSQAGAVGSGLGAEGIWFDGFCSASDTIEMPVFVPQVTPTEVAQLAQSQLRLPAPRISASPPEDQLVNVPTWLWIAGGWRELSATASVPGVSVTAVATPRSVSWSMGDGGTVTCRGPGKPFPVGGDPESSSPTCGYTYRESSASEHGGTFAVTATVRWSVSWSGAGDSGAFPGMTTESSTAFRVVEVPALNTGPPG